MKYKVSDVTSIGGKKYRNAKEIKDLFILILRLSYRE
jgi:hypothetical protein